MLQQQVHVDGAIPTQCSQLTKAGKRCRGRVMPGTEPPVCRAHLGARFGRESRMDEATTVRLVQLIGAGNYLTTALASVSLPTATFYRWLDRGNPDGVDPENEMYRDFRVRVEKARHDGEAHNVTFIASAARRDWRAAAWMLERTNPEGWGRGRAASGGGVSGEQTGASGLDQDDDPFSALPGDELGQRRAARRGTRSQHT
jgi:hypothetical protein